MKQKITIFFIGVFLCGNLFSQEVITTQGDYFTNGAGSLSWTLGESITETYVGTSNDLTQGFQQVELIAILVKEVIADVNVQIYPNPVANYLTINMGDMEGNSSFLLLDSQGKLIKQQIMLNTSLVVDFSTYARGVYFLKLQNKDHQLIKTYKIVKQ